MKKTALFLALFLALVLSFSCVLCSCNKENNKNNDDSSQINQEASIIDEEQILQEAKDLIKKKEYKKAYTLLYSIGNNAKAKELMYKFDIKPEVEKCTNLDKYGIINSEESFVSTRRFDKYGNVTHYICVSNNKATDELTREYEYDTNGNCTRIVESISPKEASTVQYTYDKDGNCIKEVYEDSDGEISTYQHEYDENGNCIKATFKYPDGSFSVNEFIYDKEGNLIEKSGIDSDGNTSIEQFGENGLVVMTKVFTAEGETYTSEFSNYHYGYKFHDHDPMFY